MPESAKKSDRCLESARSLHMASAIAAKSDLTVGIDILIAQVAKFQK